MKSWLLAIPHYIVVGILLGGGSYAASRAYDRAWGFGYETGLIGVLVFFAGVALLFTTRYPRGIFDVVLGLDRWVARVAAYVFLMRDEYPPFRLDQGGAETAGPPIEAVPAARAIRAGSCGRGPSAWDGRTGRADRRRRRRRDRRVRPVRRRLCARRRRSDPARRRRLPHVTERRFSTSTYAIVSDRADIDADGAERALDIFLGTVRLRSESDRTVFVGIGPAAEVDRYLVGVERDVVTDFDRRDPDLLATGGRRPGCSTGRPDVLGRLGNGIRGADARMEAGGRQLARRRDERRREPRRVRRDEHRRRARRGALDRDRPARRRRDCSLPRPRSRSRPACVAGTADQGRERPDGAVQNGVSAFATSPTPQEAV